MIELTAVFLLPFGGYEFLVIFFVILLLFGGKKIPELMRGIGKGIREFNSARATIEDEIKTGMKEEEAKEKKTLDKDSQSEIKGEREKEKSTEESGQDRDRSNQ